MKKCLAVLLILGVVLTLAAKNYELRRAVDPNGYAYTFVTNDPYNAREYTLKNGMKVYLSRIPVKPRISFKAAVRAGMADSPADVTGLAHYFEHMMFKGTGKIGALDYAKEKALLDRIESLFEERRRTADPAKKAELYAEIDKLSAEAAKYASAGEYSKLVSSIGGMGLNAFTASDMTVYVVDIPSQELEKLLKLESERFRDPVMRLFHTELEAVYEEFNQGQDNENGLVFEALSRRLFPSHPYGWTPFIGKAEHLKNPSITEIRKFYRSYYTPENIALLLSGDLDFDRTIQLVDRYFGALQGGAAPVRDLPREKPMTANVSEDVKGPGPERIMIGFRVEPGRRNDLLATLTASLLSNGTSGLIDHDLLRSQKVLGAGAGFYDRRDYSIFYLYGAPRAGQTLDELASLLLGELDRIKKGDFPEWLLKAVIDNYRKGLVQSRENPENASWTYLDSFIKGTPYIDNLRYIDSLADIRKEEIVRFAGSLRYHARINKRTGTPENRVKVEKPKITPVAMNADKTSDYGKKFAALPPSPLPELDTVDFKKDFSVTNEGNWKLFYSNKPFPVNDTLFSLGIVAEYGRDHDLLLPLAAGYMNFLGTDRYSASEFRNEFYKLALDFSISGSDERTSIHLSGFADRMEAGLRLIRHFLDSVKPDENAYRLYVARLMKARADAKKSHDALFRAVNMYAAYGPGMNNPLLYENSMTEKQLLAVRPADLVALMKKYFDFNATEHVVTYVGPAPRARVAELCTEIFGGKNPASGAHPARREFRQLATEKPKVYLIPYDSTQLLIGIRTRGAKFDLANLPVSMLFNQYFGGGGLDSIVFQEIRESRSLAYSAYAYYGSAMEKDKYDVFMGFVATQPDKCFTAIDEMLRLFRKMPLQPARFDNARAKLMKSMTSERSFGDLSGLWFRANKMGIAHDWRKAAFEKLRSLELKDIAAFAEKEVAPRVYEVFIAGDVKSLDREKLKRYGEIVDLAPEQVFGY